MDALVGHVPEPTGSEWFTVSQFMSRYGCGHSQALRRCKEMRDAGKLDHWKGTSAENNRRVTNKFRVKG